MPGARPGSNAYDAKRARLRKYLEDNGIASDEAADDMANEMLRLDKPGVMRGDRGLGPKGERRRDERR
jgi:hypothetical protein